MKIEITFVSITNEHFAREPSITTPRLRVERFHELLEKGVFGEKVEVSYRPFRSGVQGDDRKVVGLEYTVRANDISNDFFLRYCLCNEVLG